MAAAIDVVVCRGDSGDAALLSEARALRLAVLASPAPLSERFACDGACTHFMAAMARRRRRTEALASSAACCSSQHINQRRRLRQQPRQQGTAG
jgi:hypothetical protein